MENIEGGISSLVLTEIAQTPVVIYLVQGVPNCVTIWVIS